VQLILVALGFTREFWVALVLLAVWALVAEVGTPVGQAYLNDMIASRQRATVLSFASLMGSSGGVVVQPLLGRTADVYGYSGVAGVQRGDPVARGAVPVRQPPAARRC
jgi:MFS family permease